MSIRYIIIEEMYININIVSSFSIQLIQFNDIYDKKDYDDDKDSDNSIEKFSFP